jgi:hypothetical protein
MKMLHLEILHRGDTICIIDYAYDYTSGKKRKIIWYSVTALYSASLWWSSEAKIFSSRAILFEKKYV